MPLDPWLPERLAHLSYVTDGEQRLDRAVRSAIARWLVEVRRLVLGHQASGAPAGLAAAGDNPPPPDLSGIPASDPVWQGALRDLVNPVIADMFGERFLAAARTATISDLPYRERHMAEVFSRLKLFPREAMEDIRPELQEALAEGEPMDLVRDRIAAVLDFDTARDADDVHWHAESRRLQGEIHDVEKRLEDEGLDAAERAGLRRERSQLYTSLRRADQKWQWKARRIARTETLGAVNGGTFAGAVARADAMGIQMFKQWLATDDARTRPTHVDADGQVRPLKAPFEVGGWPLMYPCEPGGPAEEVINCRCSPLILDADELTDAQRAELGLAEDGGPAPGPAPTEPASLVDAFARGDAAGIERDVRLVAERAHLPKGVQVSRVTARVGDGRASWRVNLADAQGGFVASFEHSLAGDVARDLYVERGPLLIAQEWSDSRVVASVNAALERWYLDSGINRIKMIVNQAVGEHGGEEGGEEGGILREGFERAQEGFDWDPDAEDSQQAVTNQLLEMQDLARDAGNEDLLDEVNTLLARVRENPDNPEAWPAPAVIAQMGWVPDAPVGWPGFEVVASFEWPAMKQIFHRKEEE
jgi:Phage Mu protein F like protein